MNTLGKRIAFFRKKYNMTQLDLANEIGITDKAVSKWERDLSMPDISVIKKMAEIFGISVEELIGQADIVKDNDKKNHENSLISMLKTILVSVGLAMGIAVVILLNMKEIDVESSLEMLGLGVIGIALSNLIRSKK
uniref:helix-turn-helix domain-containing protein n=1 Tax=Agathobacter sp. TaxID=2021311 RepID=UPI004057835B